MPPPSAKEEGQNIVQRNNSTLFEITTRVQHENWQTIQPTISNPHLDRPCHGKRLLWAGDTATGKTEKYQIWSQQFLWWALSGWSCQGLSRDNVETGEERSRRLWWCETMIFSQLPWLTLFSTAHLSLHTHCSHSPTYGLLSVECWDLHIGLITEQPSLSVPQSVLAALCACERPARRPASRLCYLVVDRQVGTQLGLQTRDQSKNFTKMQSWTFLVMPAWLGNYLNICSQVPTNTSYPAEIICEAARCSMLNAHVLIKDT